MLKFLRILGNQRSRQLEKQCKALPTACFSSLPQQGTTKDADILIIGGGIMGSSAAYFIKSKSPSTNVVVIERDPKYTRAATTLSVSSIRQQFSIEENICLSMWSYQFLLSVGKHLHISGNDTPDVQLQKGGYLFMATEIGHSVLSENVALQRSLGADVELLTAKEFKVEFPWINPDGIFSASIGKSNEGWFDPWSLLQAFKRKSISLGVKYITADATDVVMNGNYTVKGVNLQDPSNPQSRAFIACETLLNAAGPWAGYLVKPIGVDLPVRPRKRHVFSFSCPKGPKDMVLAVDPSGCWFRKEGLGDLYLCGKSPDENNDPDAPDLTVDYDYFQEDIWPCIAERVPAFEELKLQHSWAGYYDYNTFDQNAIIGVHPEIQNLYLVNGFSGHGIQQSPAVGNAISELILAGKYSTIDLTRFGFERICNSTPLREKNIV